MNFENTVVVSGMLHHIKKDKQSDKYFLFAIKQESTKADGSTRRDFLVSRVFVPEIAKQVSEMAVGTPLKVSGELRVSSGSGEMYIYARAVEKV